MELLINKRDITIPEEVIRKWQSIVNIMAELIDVPAALIMKVDPPYIEVFRSSESSKNPYKVGGREHLTGLYCEQVIKTRSKLLVPNALKDKHWDKNPDIKLGMISYLGFPLLWPDDEVFGTICVLDLEENPYNKAYEQLMLQFKELVEAHLGLLYDREHLEDLVEQRTTGLKKAAEELRREIGARKKAEQDLEDLNKQLEATVEKLTLANRELQHFAHIAAHDLKAPLRAIGTLADWISTDYADKFDEEGKREVELLVGRVARMSDMIDSILRYSEAGCAIKEKEKVNLNVLIEEVMAGIAPPENISVTVENELPVLEGEKTHFMQVFQNLLSNAVKYMDKPRGQIKVGCTEENGFWKFSVADNGPGIEKEYFEKIFEMFQTLLPRDGFEATGIGLSIVKKIVETYGGSVWIESEVGRGSVFFFTLPKRKMGVKDAKLKANIVS